MNCTHTQKRAGKKLKWSQFPFKPLIETVIMYTFFNMKIIILVRSLVFSFAKWFKIFLKSPQEQKMLHVKEKIFWWSSKE